MPSDLVLLLLLCSCSLLLCDDSQITGTAGENVTLECRPQVSKDNVIKVEWKKHDLESERYVFFFREARSYVHFQDERFRGRVELRDLEMKNGDVSIVLKNVTANDSGTYECRVSVKLSRRRIVRRHEPKADSVVRLTVTEPGHTDGDTGGGDQGGGDQGGGDQGGGYQGGGDKRGHSALIAVVVLVFGVVATGFILVSVRQKSLLCGRFGVSVPPGRCNVPNNQRHHESHCSSL